MRLEYQILAAMLLDVLAGDPPWLPHPVKLIGRFASSLEIPLRHIFANARTAGAMAVLIVLIVTVLVTYAVIFSAGLLHPLVADIVSIVVLYTTFAARDLSRHSLNVYRELKMGNIEEARGKVSLLVGRDTDVLDEAGIVRATVESIAENTVDGVTAPLFFAFLAGPAGAMLYKAINTLDSTFGYKNEQYIEFGWASAKLDDLANYIPARLTAVIIPVAAVILKLSALDSLRILFRDGSKHPSPNSGLPEAAVAGALNVQLGGLNYYFGEPSSRPTLGDPVRALRQNDILQANGLMFVTMILATILFVAVRFSLHW
ncbi:MAG TPA: adenosylcobinamide-phosphate synthase CbiB [Syntrophales bacterium]|nr:adenosylcobinamide-phosphate synthase CbiB [Syntrophales bacterium]